MEEECKLLNCAHGCKANACFCWAGYNLTDDGISCQGIGYAYINITCLCFVLLVVWLSLLGVVIRNVVVELITMVMLVISLSLYNHSYIINL